MKLLPALLALACLPIAGPAQAYVPPTVPPGFTIEILTQALSQPTGLAILADGRVLVAEQKTGAIKVWSGTASAPLVGVVPNVNASAWENGLLAIAVDPGWPVRPYVYAWFNSSASQNMTLAMFTVSGDLTNPASSNLVLGAQYDILTDVPDLATIHNGGSLHFGPDGMLYLSIGDDATPCAAQDPNTLLGCILRLDVSSLPGAGAGPPAKSLLVPPGNPFSGPTVNAQLVWCHGFRNPFRFHIDSVTGNIHVGDVGSWLADEIDESSAGGENFGWPWLEGNLLGFPCGASQPAVVHPVATIPHYAPTIATIAAGCYRNAPNGASNFGMAYEGDRFYLEFYSGAVRRLKSTGTGWAPAPPVPGQPSPTDWATGFQTVADTTVGADGALYFVKQYHSHTWGALGRVNGNPGASVLAVSSGDGQPGNAGRALEQPLVARLTDAAGVPIAGAAVTFTVFVGGGSVSPAVATTDSQGLAAASYVLAPVYSQEPIVLATAGTAYTPFTATWRGITIAGSPPTGTITLEIRHSETNSPFTLAWEPPPPAPYLTSAWGDIWTSVLSPMPGTGAADGLGLLGMPDPLFRTQATVPSYVLSVSGMPPTGGLTLIVQAYAIDWSIFPAAGSIMISNAETLTLP